MRTLGVISQTSIYRNHLCSCDKAKLIKVMQYSTINIIKNQHGHSLMDTVKSHKEIHGEMISHLGIDQYKISTFAPNITLSKCNDENGLLPNWMFRADMISSMLIGRRCFDVAYIRNDEAISYLSYVDMEEAVLSLPEKDSYLNFPFFPDIPKSFKSLITALAITESLEIDHNKKEVAIKPIIGFFQMPKHGQTLVYPTIQALEAHRFHDLLQSVKPLMRLDKNQDMNVKF